MLAGLLFAVRDADDRPDRPAATLPFVGGTLIEYQARLLIAAGVSQIVIVVAKLTPDLLGAVSRIARRGVTVDAVRNAGEAAEKLHPLSRLLVLSDGLVTTEGIVASLAGEGTDTLLVLGEGEAGPAFERIGGKLAWAGIARLGYLRLREVAAMPRDYDFQSALLHAASQAGAAHRLLPVTATADGHGIEYRAASLDGRGRAVLATAVSGGRSWFDRFVVAPIGRAILPIVAARGIGTAAPAGAGGALAFAGLSAIFADWPTIGLALSLGSVITLLLGATLARLRDEPVLAHTQLAAGALVPAIAALLLSWRLGGWPGDASAMVLAIGVVTLAGLSERAIRPKARLLGWGSPGAYLVIVLIGATLNGAIWGLAASAVYAAATLAMAIEALRRDA